MPNFSATKIEEQREFGALIPDGTFVKLTGKIRHGGRNLPPGQQGPRDEGLFKISNSGSFMLDWEYTVMVGPYARQKLWQNMVIEGGSVNSKGESVAGNISKQQLRAMWESGCNIDPKDLSAAAEARRDTPNYDDLNGIIFAARIGVEAGGAKDGGGYYQDKNRIAIVVVPGMPEYQPVMAGQEVEAKPSGATGGGKPRGGAAGPSSAAQAAKPAWQRDAAPAQAGTGAAAPAWAQSGGTVPQTLPGMDPRVVAAEPTTPVSGGTAGPAWLNGR